MNRKGRRAFAKEQHAFVSEFPATLTEIPASEFPHSAVMPTRAWKSRKYLVQEYEQSTPHWPLLIRLSVCRVRLGSGDRWEDGITWDELQAIKNEVGYGDWYGIEIYPPDKDVVNVANLRHLWLLPFSLKIGWTKENK